MLATPALPTSAFSPCLHCGHSIGRKGGSDVEERPSPAPSLSPLSLCPLHWLLALLCSKLAATATGLSFPASEEDELSVFRKEKKLDCAFMAEKLRAVSACSYWYCRALNGPAIFINKTCLRVVTPLGNDSRFAFYIQCVCKCEPQKKHLPLPCFKELKCFHPQVIEPKHFQLF